MYYDSEPVRFFFFFLRTILGLIALVLAMALSTLALVLGLPNLAVGFVAVPMLLATRPLPHMTSAGWRDRAVSPQARRWRRAG